MSICPYGVKRLLATGRGVPTCLRAQAGYIVHRGGAITLGALEVITQFVSNFQKRRLSKRRLIRLAASRQ